MGSEGPTGAELDSKKIRVSPRGFGILEAHRLRRGRASYARVRECRCRCVSSLLRTDDEGPVVNQVLNDIPESEAIIRRMPHGSMVIAVLARIVPPRKRIWWRASFREPQERHNLGKDSA